MWTDQNRIKKFVVIQTEKYLNTPFCYITMIDLNSMKFLVIHLNFYKKIYVCGHTKSKITEDPFLFYVIIVLTFVYFSLYSLATFMGRIQGHTKTSQSAHPWTSWSRWDGESC